LKIIRQSKLVIDPDTGLILDANHAAAQYYGWTREELKQMKIEQINILSAEEVKMKWRRRACIIESVEFRHAAQDGSIEMSRYSAVRSKLVEKSTSFDHSDIRSASVSRKR